MQIVLCADNVYADEALQCVEYIKKTQKATIHLLGDNICLNNKIKLEQQGVNVVDFKSREQLKQHWTPHFLKLFIPEYFPCLDKVIYLDTDTIPIRRLLPLWNTNISDYYAAGTINVVTPIAKYIKFFDYTFLHPNTKIMNTGVMVLNLQKWRADNITEKLVRYTHDSIKLISKNNNSLDVVTEMEREEYSFNVLLANKWLPIDDKWNVTRLSRVKTPYIVHLGPWRRRDL